MPEEMDRSITGEGFRSRQISTAGRKLNVI
jgi:hypothetical protein